MKDSSKKIQLSSKAPLRHAHLDDIPTSLDDSYIASALFTVTLHQDSKKELKS
jgi:hypothetical protein